MLRAAFNPAGGIRYHLRARRHRERAWAPFRAAIADWLAAWNPGTASLAIVGPSGGHCLPDAFLGRFERVLGFEPDPVARMIFARRLRRLPVSPTLAWVGHDAWIAPVRAGRGDTIGAPCSGERTLMRIDRNRRSPWAGTPVKGPTSPG